MANINDKLCDAAISSIVKTHHYLSNEAKLFIKNELYEDDIIDYQEALFYYQHIIEDRFFTEPDDEQDFYLIEIIKVLINCLLDNLNNIY